MNMPSYGFTPAVQFTSTVQRWCIDIIDRDRVDQKRWPSCETSKEFLPVRLTRPSNNRLGTPTSKLAPFIHTGVFLPVKNLFTVSTPVRLRTACRS